MPEIWGKGKSHRQTQIDELNKTFLKKLVYSPSGKALPSQEKNRAILNWQKKIKS